MLHQKSTRFSRHAFLARDTFINNNNRHNTLNPFTDDSNSMYHVSVRLTDMKCESFNCRSFVDI